LNPYAFEQFAATRTFGALAYDPSGERLFYIANTTGQRNLWALPSGGGFPQQLTSFSEERVTDFSVSPDGQQLAFLADRHGDEMTQVWRLPAAGGWPERLTDVLAAQFTLGEWLDDERVVVTANDKEPSEQHPQLLDTKAGERQRLLTGGIFYGATVSPAAEHLLILEFLGNTNQNLYVYDVSTGQKTLATPHQGDAVHFPGPWTQNGFYLLTNEGREFTGLAFYSLAEGKWAYVFTPEHDVEKVVLSRDRKLLVAVVNEAGASQLYALDLEHDKELALPRLPYGVVEQLDVHPSREKIALLLGTATEADNIFELDLTSGELKALEQSMLGGVRQSDLLEPELISYPSFDRDVPAWLYRPEPSERRVPVVLSIHGGPESQERPEYAYNGLYQYLLSRGIGVLAPNIRGSTGYGISYQKLIHRDWGGGELGDVRHAAEYLRTLDWVDPAQLAVFGGSFGGFATLSALTRLPEYWATGVDLVGPSNLVTFVESVPPFWRPTMRDWVGDAEDDRDFLLERSPITYIDQIRAPLLVMQGANDPRVVQAESDQMVEGLRQRNLDVTYYVDEKSGHGPSSREDGVRWMKMIAEYLEDKLLENVSELS